MQLGETSPERSECDDLPVTPPFWSPYPSHQSPLPARAVEFDICGCCAVGDALHELANVGLSDFITLALPEQGLDAALYTAPVSGQGACLLSKAPSSRYLLQSWATRVGRIACLALGGKAQLLSRLNSDVAQMARICGLQHTEGTCYDHGLDDLVESPSTVETS